MPEHVGASALPVIHRTTIGADWVDFNGHLRDGYYMVLFSSAVDALMDLAGLNSVARQACGHSWFTLEAHICYLHEVKAGAAVEVRLQLLGLDTKRLHVALSLHPAGGTPLLALTEQMLLNVDMAGPRASAFAPAVAAYLQPLAAQHALLPRPAQVGRVMALPQPKQAVGP
jgi:acyl-CoA thioester hydrolase